MYVLIAQPPLRPFLSYVTIWKMVLGDISTCYRHFDTLLAMASSGYSATDGSLMKTTMFAVAGYGLTTDIHPICTGDTSIIRTISQRFAKKKHPSSQEASQASQLYGGAMRYTSNMHHSL